MPTEDPFDLTLYGQPERLVGAAVVVRHPLADQTALLERLGLSPSACTSCDLYVGVADGLFLSIAADPALPALASYHYREGNVPHSFFVRTHTSLLTTAIVEQILSDVLDAFERHADSWPRDGSVCRIPLGSP